MLKVQVDYQRCTGLGMCESLAPLFFEVDDDGDLQLLREDVTEEEAVAVREAIAACPTEALRMAT